MEMANKHFLRLLTGGIHGRRCAIFCEPILLKKLLCHRKKMY